MRYYSISAIIMAVAAATLVTSCEIEPSRNGKLDGYWHLERVDTLQTGGVCDMSRRRIYWAVQARLLYLKNVDDAEDNYFMRFRQTHDSLVLSEPYLYRWHQDQEGGGDHPVTDPARLAGWGINSLEEHFVKEHLSSSGMTLRNERLRLYFRKF